VATRRHGKPLPRNDFHWRAARDYHIVAETDKILALCIRIADRSVTLTLTPSCVS